MGAASIKETAKTIAAGMVQYYTGDRPGDVPGNLPDPYCTLPYQSSFHQHANQGNAF
jgi:hypothetical protein